MNKTNVIRKKVTIIGLGYVGLPLACAIAKTKKFEVCGYEIDERKAKLIREGISPVGDQITQKLLPKVKLQVSSEDQILSNSDYFIVCVPTPVKKNKLPDLRPIEAAARLVLKYLRKGQYVVIESTINPGVCEEVILPILEESGLKGGKDFELSHCPERINPGDPKWNVLNIPRNVGSLSQKGNKHIANFYRSFLEGKVNEVNTIKVAEATKIIENTFRDINIAYVNELAKSFDIMGIDLVEAIQAASNKPFSFVPHYPSCGVGGHCIPVDPYYLISRAKKAGFDHSFLRKARQVNNSMPRYAVKLLEMKLKECGLTYESAKIGVLGLSYKANVGDMRESPSLEILRLLRQNKALYRVYDPYVPSMSNTKTIEELFSWVNVILLTTDHKEFVALPVGLFKKNHIKAVIDGKNCLDKNGIVNAGIIYKGIGR